MVCDLQQAPTYVVEWATLKEHRQQSGHERRPRASVTTRTPHYAVTRTHRAAVVGHSDAFTRHGGAPTGHSSRWGSAARQGGRW